MDQKRIWIVWETQRRSIQLSKALNCKLFIIELNGIFRYPVSILKSLYIFFIERPTIIFVQNPSMILAALACLYCRLLNIPLVVDRHTTFLLDKPILNTWKRLIFIFLHKFTIKKANITIVTNDHLAELVKQSMGNPFILPDPLPIMFPTHKKTLKGNMTILVPSSFRHDEPIDQIIQANKLLAKENMFFYITGNYRKYSKNLISEAPPNVIVTGFLPDQEYVDLLYSVDAVMVLTKATSCMLCGCYEAISAEKPLITSLKPVLKNYFYDAIFVDNSTASIVQACLEMAKNVDIYRKKSKKMKESISTKWEEYLKAFEKELNRII